MRLISLLLALALIVAACSSDSGQAADSFPGPGDEPPAVPELLEGQAIDFGSPPTVPAGPIDTELAELLASFDQSLSMGFSALTTNVGEAELARMVEFGDARLLWFLADVMRFPFEGGIQNQDVIDAFETLSGVSITGDDAGRGSNPWTAATNHLIAWDLPAFPGYLEAKRGLFTTIEPQWEDFFTPDADVDWRLVSWGGVLIDDRLIGNGDRCVRGCIPALDDPAVTPAEQGDWYPDDELIFGVEVNGEFRAYPKNMMEIHEMVNDTLGGRRLAIPYCTLCGSAQAYLTDALPAGTIEGDELPIMRTSGLLIRSNKMMFELRTRSLVDTFLGAATSGPLQGSTFEQVSVATSTWGEWKAAHPDTTILASDGGIGRTYAADPLRGRDDDGPIFPIGAVDPRLPVQQQILGFEASDGTAVAVHVDIARATLLNDTAIMIGDVEIELAGDGIRAVRGDGVDIGAHQAFWFAWSQFHPDTVVWPGDL